MPIEWLSTKLNPPLAGKEIIARNPLKPVGYMSAAKQCKIMIFLPSFTEKQIISRLMDDNLTTWSYTNE